MCHWAAVFDLVNAVFQIVDSTDDLRRFRSPGTDPAFSAPGNDPRTPVSQKVSVPFSSNDKKKGYEM